MDLLTKQALFELIRLKSLMLHDNSQIRLMPEMGYNVYEKNGAYYIGYNMSEPEEPFFPNVKELTMEGADNKVIGKLQCYDPKRHYHYKAYL